MSEPKFTKGPWCIKDNYYIVGNDGLVIATHSIVTETDKANASLIKTAPKMYMMLEKCKKTLRDVGFPCMADDIYWLLKEARGEE